MFNLHFVLAADFLTLTVHCRHVGLIPVRQLVHSLDKVVSLSSELSKLLLHKLLLLTSFDLLASQSLEFIVELGESPRRLLVLLLQSAQIVGSTHQVCIDCMSFSLDLLGEFLLLVELGKQ